MKKILFASHNPSKLNLYRNMLKNEKIALISLSDLNIDYEVEEIGNDVSEIAINKVTEYSRLTNYITISEDTGLYFEGVDDSEQPGQNVNKINGVKMSEEERIEHYLKLINKYGGRLDGYWKKSVAVCDTNGKIYTFDYIINKIFVNKAHEKRNVGYPLDSISITPEFNKYTVELTDEDNNKMNDMSNREIYLFLTDTLAKIYK